MKKYIVFISIVLIVVMGIFICKNNTKQIKEDDIIIKVNKDNLTKTPEKSILNYYKENKDAFIKVADYLLASEKLFATRPIIISQQNSTYIEKIEDEDVRKLVYKLVKEGTIKQISSLNDEIKDVFFYINSEYGVYEQGIRYVSDKQKVYNDKTKYNYIKDYVELGNGWFYYLCYYNEIKDADIFREIAWNEVSEGERKTVVNDWHKAIVTLEDDDFIGYKEDNKKRNFVISVCFNTKADSWLGPIVFYFDPLTKEVVGRDLRF